MNFRDAAQAIGVLEDYFNDSHLMYTKYLLSSFPKHTDHKKFMDNLRQYILGNNNIPEAEAHYLLSLIDLGEAIDRSKKLNQEFEKEQKESNKK